MADVELLPCPFCGRTPRDWPNRSLGMLFFACSVSGCCTGPGRKTEAEAAAAWNARAAMTQENRNG